MESPQQIVRELKDKGITFVEMSRYFDISRITLKSLYQGNKHKVVEKILKDYTTEGSYRDIYLDKIRSHVEVYKEICPNDWKDDIIYEICWD